MLADYLEGAAEEAAGTTGGIEGAEREGAFERGSDVGFSLGSTRVSRFGWRTFADGGYFGAPDSVFLSRWNRSLSVVRISVVSLVSTAG